MAHSGSTPKMGWPFPIEDDDVDVPVDMEALAVAIETDLGYVEVTSLPGSPTDGDLIVLTTPTSGISQGGRFRLRRVAGVWLCEGGTPAYVAKDGSTGAITASGAVVAPGDGSMQLTLTPGVWEIEWGCLFARPVSSGAGVCASTQPQGAGLPVLGNPGSPNAECLLHFPGFATGAGFGAYFHQTRRRRFTLTSANGSVITEMFTALNGVISAQSRYMTAFPVRL